MLLAIDDDSDWTFIARTALCVHRVQLIYSSRSVHLHNGDVTESADLHGGRVGHVLIESIDSRWPLTFNLFTFFNLFNLSTISDAGLRHRLIDRSIIIRNPTHRTHRTHTGRDE